MTAEPPPVGVCLAAAAWMAFLIYAITGIRWYFSLMLLTSAAAVIVWMIYGAGTRRLELAASGAVLIVVLAEILPFGAPAYLPNWARAILRPTMAREVSLAATATGVVGSMEGARQNVLTYKGGTDIQIVKKKKKARGSLATDPVESDQPRFEVATPISKIERIFAASVAMLVPRSLASRLHWIDMAGGRGLWMLADADTILFDATFVATLVLVWQALRQGAVRHLLFWHTALTAFLLTGPLLYSTANFGTLFRQRAMLFLCFVLLPLTIGRARESSPTFSLRR